MAKPVDFAKLSPRAQEFFRQREAKRKAAAKRPRKSGKGGAKGGGS